MMEQKTNMAGAMGITRAVDRSIATISRRVPLWSLGICCIIAVLIGGAWLLKDSLLAINSNAEKIKAVESEIAHCKEMRAEMERQIAYLREENATLKQRVAALEQITARTKMP